MAQNDDLSSLERVRQRLYNPKEEIAFEEPHLSEQAASPSMGWEKTRVARTQSTKPRISGPARFFILALLVFVITLAGAAFYLLYGGRSVSTDNILITVQGPTTIASGDTVPLLITIQNKNPVAIHGATLSLDFPDGTKDPVDPSAPLSHFTQDIGDIAPGASSVQTVRASLFGSEGQNISLPIKLEYTLDGSNSTFLKNTKYDLTVTTSPLALTVDSLSQVSSGQPVTVTVSVRSNATTPLNNVAVSANYPSFGFVLASTSPKPTANNLFTLGTLAPGDEKRITLTGTLSGDNNDERIFTFSAGVLNATDSPQLSTSYTTKEADVRITKPFLATTLTVNADSSDNPVLTTGAKQQAMVSWVNTLTSAITNGQITVKLAGAALDPASVIVTNGFYRSSDATVIFGPDSSVGLANLQPGDTGQGTISFSTKSSADMQALRQPTITFTVSASGQRIGESSVPETITSSVTRTAKVATNLGLAVKIVHTTGPFKNTGPWPPTVNAETTYTVQYALTNTVNAVAGAKVTAVLPSYVRFTGQVSGAVTYNETTRTVTWTAGDVPAGTLTPMTAAFQVAITPSVSQSHTSPVLLGAQQVTGTDRFTQGQISGSLQELNTQISLDPAYTITAGQVQ